MEKPYTFKIVEAMPHIIDPSNNNLFVIPMHEFYTGNFTADYLKAGLTYKDTEANGKMILLYLVYQGHELLLSDPDPVRFEQAHAIVQKLIRQSFGF